MLLDLSVAQSTDTHRILNAGGINRILHRWRLPTHARIATLLDAFSAKIYLYKLWNEVFAEPPPPMRLGNLQAAFVRKVDSERFPVDVDALECLVSERIEDIDLLELPLPYDSFGVPWETEVIHELPWWAQAVVAVVIPIVYGLDESDRDDVAHWLAKDGFPQPAYEYITEGSGEFERLRQALDCQEPPLDGLSVVLDCIVKETSNVFLDNPPILAGREEYGGNQFFWNKLNVKMLHDMYLAVQTKAKRLRAYIRWCQRTSGFFEYQVVRLLTRLVDEPWHVEECRGAHKKVVFDGD